MQFAAEGSSSIWQSTGLQNRRLGVRVPPALLPSFAMGRSPNVSMNRQQRRSSQGDVPDDDDGSVEPVSTEIPERRSRVAAPTTSRRRTTPRQFLHEVNVEMRKVVWPSRAETINYSAVVLVTLVTLMAMIFGLDLVFTKVATFLFT